MNKLTPKIIKDFSKEEKILYQAGLIDENKQYTDVAEEYAISSFLDKQKKDLVAMGKELLEEEKRSLLVKISDTVEEQ